MQIFKNFDIWIYRPDIEAAARRINRNFVYNGCGKAFFDVLEQKKDGKPADKRTFGKKEKTAADKNHCAIIWGRREFL